MNAVTNLAVPGAIVALQDKDGKTVAWTKTDASGRYILAADTLRVLQLTTPVGTPRRRSTGQRVGDAFGEMLTAPVRLVGEAMHMSAGDTLRLGASAFSGPASFAGALAGRVGSAALGRVTDAAARDVVSARRSSRGDRDKPLPGEAGLRIEAPGYEEVSAHANAYWLDAPTDDTGSSPIGVAAELEPVAIAPAGSEKSGGVRDAAIILEDLRSDRMLVPAGESVSVSVKLKDPDGRASLPVRVFARESSLGTTSELIAKDGQFAGSIIVPASAQTGDVTVTIVALRTSPVGADMSDYVLRRDPVAALVQVLPELHADHVWEWDPRLFAARNRLELHLSVLGAKEFTP